MSEFANFWGWPFSKLHGPRTRVATHQFKTLKGEYRLIYHIILVLGSCILFTLFLRLYVSVRNTRLVRITS